MLAGRAMHDNKVTLETTSAAGSLGMTTALAYGKAFMWVAAISMTATLFASLPFAIMIATVLLYHQTGLSIDTCGDPAGVMESRTCQAVLQDLKNFANQSVREQITSGRTLIKSWLKSKKEDSDNEEIKILIRGASLTGARRAAKVFSGFAPYSELVEETDKNLFWLFDASESGVTSAIIYANFSGTARGEPGMLLLFAILKSELQSLIDQGHVRDRSGHKVSMNSLEFGFDESAVPYLVGPVVIPL